MIDSDRVRRSELNGGIAVVLRALVLEKNAFVCFFGRCCCCCGKFFSVEIFVYSDEVCYGKLNGVGLVRLRTFVFEKRAFVCCCRCCRSSVVCRVARVRPVWLVVCVGVIVGLVLHRVNGSG